MYDIGDTVRLGNDSAAIGSAAFASMSGIPTDPTEAVLTVRKPDGMQFVFVWPTPGVGEDLLIHPTTGRFYADVIIDQSGMWGYELVGTGAVAAAASARIHVGLSTTR